jgi:hypothetical protein
MARPRFVVPMCSTGHLSTPGGPGFSRPYHPLCSGPLSSQPGKQIANTPVSEMPTTGENKHLKERFLHFLKYQDDENSYGMHNFH